MNPVASPVISLSTLLNPRSVAIIGASDDPARIGGRPIDAMRKLGYAGRILPVNPNRREVQGLPAYASVADLPEVPDNSFSSASLAFSLKPWVMKKAVEPITAPKAINGLSFRANQTITESKIETTA